MRERLEGGTRGRLAVQGVRGAARPLLVALAAPSRQALLVICADSEAAEAMAADVRFFLGEREDAGLLDRRVHLLPSWDVPPFEDLSPPPDVTAARQAALHQLRHGTAPIVVAPAAAVVQRVAPPETVAGNHAYLVAGDALDRDHLAARLAAWGYRRVELVEDSGEFAVRGSILDVFPPGHPLPVRIELDGDLIESMHAFDPVTQRWAAVAEELLLLPAAELPGDPAARERAARAVEERARELETRRDERNLLVEAVREGLPYPGREATLPYFHERLATLFDHLPDKAGVCLDRPAEVEAALEQAWEEVEQRARERHREARFYPEPERLYVPPSEVRSGLGARSVVELEPLHSALEDRRAGIVTLRSFRTTDLRIRTGQRHKAASFEPVARRVREWCAEGYRVLCVAGSDAHGKRLRGLFATHGVEAVESAASFPEAVREWVPRPVIVHGPLRSGVRLPDARLVVITESDLFGDTRRSSAPRTSLSQLLRSLNELRPGDYVVHLDHGIGLYRGLRHLAIAGTEGDFLHLEYAGGDRLYVPVDRISLVQKFVGADGQAPALDRLGGTSWERVKRRTRESVMAMARELIELHAAREILERRPVPPPDGLFREFEAQFPFEETPDQKRAIEEVIADLQQPRPMDRLICGDVGYGKTEVAMRAAFLAAMDGRQVAVLVPTTVLARQHLDTFRRRFEPYPVRVEMLSRLHGAAETKRVVDGLRRGTVDIVIGTQRLLQRDVEIPRLGLLIVDEEHRFGVRDKERIKQMRRLVDVLTLTATPIPRTLQMSLADIRALSVIETPPVDRQAIRTYVTRYDDDVIRDAIRRELARGGQAFFVHNRVENIEVMAQHLRGLVPEARIAVAHGQMHERQLERVMIDFLERRFDVLLCTTIIEAGLDIPSANTIIINRADTFGLAQLYQLRGRVGRSHERAYAYLLIPGLTRITADARKRLQALEEMDDLGSGFRLAAHDLEIRGAGNLLGKQQSGHVAAVGFELYTQMLEDAVRELRGAVRRTEVEPEIQLGIPAYLPASYVPDENQRLALYRRLAAATSRGEIDEIAAELRERFGPVPPLADNLLRLMDLRRFLKDSLVVRATANQGSVTLQFHPDALVDPQRLVELVASDPDRFRLTPEAQLRLRVGATDWDGMTEELVAVLRRLAAPVHGGRRAAEAGA